VPVTLAKEDLQQTLERAYLLAISDRQLPGVWMARAEQLAESPSVGFIAAVGSVLLAKATDDAIDALVIQTQEGSPGAFNLRAAATALASKRRAFAYDIGSSSDRDPINHGTLVSSTRWDVAQDRIKVAHKPFFALILTWLPDINRMASSEATEALAAYIRVRRAVVAGAAVERVPGVLDEAPTLTSLIEVIDGFVAADPEGGSRGMALVAAAYRVAGFDAVLPSRNDPRRIDIAIKRDGALVTGAEVKQIATTEATAHTLATDVADAGAQRALLAVLRPGMLASFDRSAVIRRAELEHGVVLRVAVGTRELLHEVLAATTADIAVFCASLPRAFAEALRDIRTADETIATWVAIATRWSKSEP
jgi:hypothetical protein